MRQESSEAYSQALKAGQKYYKAAVGRGTYPYPPALDEIVDVTAAAGLADLGVVSIPAEKLAGTKSAGRGNALAGNFMPLLEPGTEFAVKWMSLYDIQTDGEGIRDPIKCYEYMGRFYVQEGNKRCSVLLALASPTLTGEVTRVIPRLNGDPAVQAYYAFMRFYALSGSYAVEFRRPEDYARLQAALGFDADHVWTEEERRSFSAGLTKFRAAFERLNRDGGETTAEEALLVWLQVFPFSEIKELAPAELEKRLWAIWPDVALLTAPDPIALSTEPEDQEGRGLLSKLLSPAPSHLNIAFLYAFDPEKSAWTRAHDLGRQQIEERLGDRVTVKTYRAYGHEIESVVDAAVEDGAQLIFATTPNMIGACRRAAAEHPELKILNCGLSLPYAGVRMYYSRVYESKFITGAVAGAMAERDEIGYVANYPIIGTPAEIDAFALGVRMTNPRARVRLVWSCTPGDPLHELAERGVTVVSNRVAAGPENAHKALEWGTWMLGENGLVTPLATPCWNWGSMYERIVLSVFAGTWDDLGSLRAVNYWWGFDSGVIDVALSDALPDGPRSLAEMLKRGLAEGRVDPFRSRITDQNGVLRCDGVRGFTPEEIMDIDWLCDNVDGAIPGFDALSPRVRDTVRLLGLYREALPPEKAQGPERR